LLARVRGVGGITVRSLASSKNAAAARAGSSEN
jgi:hypothetical protein